MNEAFRRSMYKNLLESFPELFANPPGATIEIITDPEGIAAAEAAQATRLADAGLPGSMSQTGVVYMDPFVTLIRDAVRMPSGGYGTYVRLIPAGNSTGVVVLPRYGEDVVLVRHFRHSTRDWRLEVPRGFGTAGSDPEDDARRELREEIGVEAAALHDLGVTYSDTGLTGSPVRLYFAEITEPPTAAGADEGIEAVQTVSAVQFAEMIRDETIADGFTINAYARAVLRGLLPA